MAYTYQAKQDPVYPIQPAPAAPQPAAPQPGQQAAPMQQQANAAQYEYHKPEPLKLTVNDYCYRQGTQEPNQYYYYNGGTAGKLDDITPSQQPLQQELYGNDDHKTNEYELHESLATPKQLENDLSVTAPTCPGLLYTVNASKFSMPIRHIRVSTECHIATAFVTMSILFQNTSQKKVNALFVIPCHGTVTSATVSINEGARFLDTTFIDKESAEQFTNRKNKKQEEAAKYIPDLFKLPIPSVKRGETVRVTVQYMMPLPFVNNRYHLVLPMNFGNGILPQEDRIDIECTINCLTPGIEYGSTTHHLALTERGNLRCRLVATPKVVGDGRPSSNKDFHLHYLCRTNAISTAVLHDPASKSFVAFVNPPASAPDVYARDIVFILDRSGSMSGKPYNDAVQGLIFALRTLTPRDRFTVIAFDHEQVIFNPAAEAPPQSESGCHSMRLYPADPNTVEKAVYFLNTTPARGLTDIRTPLMASMQHLNQNNQGNVPFVVLLTDGAVADEKEIVKSVAAMPGNRTRVLTFGIGSYCNEYFLKMLSSTTRGWHSGCIYPHDLYPKISIMMDRAKTPILTDVGLEIPPNLGAQVFPATTPDLFRNGPIVLSGKYQGQMPPELVVTGRQVNGQMLRIPVRVDTSKVVPIEKVMVKQRMDDLVARYWMTGDESIKKEAVNLSVEETFPSPYTSMVAYELTPKEKEKSDKDKKSKKKKKGLSGKQIAALTGGAVIVGAGVFLLGAVALTMANVNVIDAVGGGLGNVGDLLGSIDCPCDGCMECISCGNCDCGAIAGCFSCGVCPDCDGCLDAIPCGDCDGGCVELPGCGCIGGIADALGDCFGGCCEGIGDICGNICGFIPGCFDAIGGCCGDICGNIGDLFGNCGDLCGNCGDMLGGCGEICCDLCSVVKDAVE